MALSTLYEELLNPEKNFLIQNSYVAWGVFISYIAFVKFVGPSIMKNRKPMELTSIMLLYNSVMVVSNLYLSCKLVKYVVESWPYRCDIYSSPLYTKQQNFLHLCMTGFLVKFAELFDTVLFVLRKKFNQVSFLHVFHHSMMFIMVWMCLHRNVIAYYVIVIGSINCPIHVLLYSYYALAALGPGVRKYLWWKKYLTRLQITQFFILMIHMLTSFFSGCENFGYFDNIALYVLIINTALFINFYRNTYKTQRVQ